MNDASPAALLLRGAFLDRADALAAWRAWQSGASLDDVDPECFAVLPLMHQRLEVLGVDDPELGRLKEVRDKIWDQNQMVLREATEALKDLDAAGIDSLLLGGMALTIGYYRDAGLRPIRQIEILVPRANWQRAAGILALGSYRVVLREHALSVGCPRRVETAWWDNAVGVEVLESGSSVLGASDQLVHTLVSAMHQGRAPATWWMADALMILSADQLDTERVVELARDLRVTLFVRRALEQIEAMLGRAVAEELLESLNESRVTAADRLEFEYASKSRWKRPLRSWLVAPVRRFFRSHS